MIEAIPAEISNIKTMSKHLRIEIDTQETVTPETVAKLFALKDKVGWFFFAEQDEKLPDKIDTAKLPKIEKEEGQKSPSTRLRAAFFVLWEQRGKPMGSFEQFYASNMEKLINQVKELLT